MQKFRNKILTKLKPDAPANAPRGGGVGRDGPVGEHPPDELGE